MTDFTVTDIAWAVVGIVALGIVIKVVMRVIEKRRGR